MPTSTEYKRKQTERRHSEGLCSHCSLPNSNGFKSCDECRSKNKAMVMRRKERGLCACGNPKVEGKKSCSDCLARVKAKNDRRRSNGLCQCGCPPATGKLSCESCILMRKNIKQRRIEQHLCGQCGEARHGTTTKCLACLLKEIAGNSLGSQTRWRELVWLWNKQNGCCAYTGVKMKYDDAHLDHIVPRSKGGANELSNLQWVLEDVNLMKRNLLEDQFLNLVGLISNHRTL